MINRIFSNKNIFFFYKTEVLYLKRITFAVYDYYICCRFKI
ncbi:hypothetical protein LEP1GSC042_1016 [Leptospira kirschneri serovar Bim str. PUO 1247]|nr:hypothetical protein LEP1GSC042_1016 [Leptospira kirschneri serovar Bim str. PUO 1247]